VREHCKLTRLATKEQILKNAGYSYSFERELYLNRKAKKAFSVEFVEDNSEEEIERRIQESIPDDEWDFFFVDPPSPAVKRELTNLLG
jgi:hypothetical protein